MLKLLLRVECAPFCLGDDSEGAAKLVRGDLALSAVRLVCLLRPTEVYFGSLPGMVDPYT